MSLHRHILMDCGLLPETPAIRLKGHWYDHFERADAADNNRTKKLAESGAFGDVYRVSMMTSSPSTLSRDGKTTYALKLFRNNLSKKDLARLKMLLSLTAEYTAITSDNDSDNDNDNNSDATTVKSAEKWPATLVQYLRLYKFDAAPKNALLMNFIDGQSLQTLIAEQRQATQPQWLCWMRDVAEALAFLHRNNFTHRDIHSGNIVVSRDGRRAHLVDLDLMCAPLMTNKDCQTLCRDVAAAASTAPDIWCQQDAAAALPEQYFASDIWALAATFLSYSYQIKGIMAAKLPYTQRNETLCKPIAAQKISAVVRSLISFGNVAQQPQVKKLFAQMLSADWRQRPTIEAILQQLPADCAEKREKFVLPTSGEELRKRFSQDKENVDRQQEPIYL